MFCTEHYNAVNLFFFGRLSLCLISFARWRLLFATHNTFHSCSLEGSTITKYVNIYTTGRYCTSLILTKRLCTLQSTAAKLSYKICQKSSKKLVFIFGLQCC